MPDTVFIDGMIQGQLHQVACDAVGMTGSTPVMAWLTSQLAGTPYSLAAIRQLQPQLVCLFGNQHSLIDYSDTGEAPAPQLARLVPESLEKGGADVTLHVYGRQFVPRSQIVFNGGVESTTFVSPTELTTVVAGATATTPGAYPVQVETPGPGGGLTGGGWFFVLGTGAITVGRECGSVQWQVPLQQKGGGFSVGT